MLYIFCGYPFSGKTTLSKQLAGRFDFARIDIDEVKWDQVGQIYDDDVTPEQWKEIFDDYYARIKNALRSGKSVVNDNSNPSRKGRDLLRSFAKETGTDSFIIFVDTPIEIVKKRWQENKITKERFDVTDKTFNWALDEMEKPTEEENIIVANFGEGIENLIDKLNLS